MPALPPNYQEVFFLPCAPRLGRLSVFIWLGVLAAFWLFSLYFTWVYDRFTLLQRSAFNLSTVSLLIALLSAGLLHEIAHALCMRGLGAPPTLGGRGAGGATLGERRPFASLTLAAWSPDYAFTRNQYALVTLAPLVALTFLATLGIGLWAASATVVGWLMAMGIANGIFSATDIELCWLLARQPQPAYVVDQLDGLHVYAPEAKQYSSLES